MQLLNPSTWPYRSSNLLPPAAPYYKSLLTFVLNFPAFRDLLQTRPINSNRHTNPLTCAAYTMYEIVKRQFSKRERTRTSYTGSLLGLDNRLKRSTKDVVPELARDTEAELIVEEVMLEVILLELLVP